jgi:general stress protein YciG
MMFSNVTEEHTMATDNRGFAAMDEDKQREVASEGGKASSEKQDMSELGKKGAAAQSTKDKAKGGEHSHGGQ